jgi:hypothetical protein
VRHGLCAETVIEIVEDVEDYKGFESAIIADYDARTVVEREMVLRLASLLWRIRRATSIETDLMRIQAEILRDYRCQSKRAPEFYYSVLEAESALETKKDLQKNWNDEDSVRGPGGESDFRSDPDAVGFRDLTYSFQRLTNLDNGAFDRLGRYEAALWRQVVQVLFVLQPRKRR